MRLAGYLRVSTRRQARDGWSLDEQRARIEAWAAGQHELLFFEDAAVSGAAPLDRRRGLLRALGCLYRAEVEGIVVARLDRLTRDLVLQETLLVEIWRHGGVVLSTVDVEADMLRPDDPADPARRLIRQVMGAVIEYQKSTSRLYLEACRARKGEAGGYIGGRPRYGWKAQDGDLVPDPAQQAGIVRVKHHHHLGRSLRQVARALETEGVPGPEGGGWSPTAVGRVLRAEGERPTSLLPGKPKKPPTRPRPSPARPRRRKRPPPGDGVRRNGQGKAIVPRPHWRGTTETAPW